MPWPNDSNPFVAVPAPGTPLATNHILSHQQIQIALTGVAAFLGLSNIGTLFILGDSYADGVGNYSYLQGGTVIPNQFSNGPTAFQILGTRLGFPACGIGAYTPAGTAGTNYSVAGAGINFNVNGSYPSLLQQITKLLADHPTLPTNSVVFLQLTGINDITAQNAVGWQWTSPYNTTWTITGAQTVPNSTATMVVNVTSSTGAVAGGSNQIAIPYGTLGAGTYLPNIPITAVGAGTISWLQNQPAWNGLVLPNNGVITTMAQNDIVTELNLLAPKIANLISAGAAAIIVTVPFPNGYLPAYTSSAALANSTTQMYTAQLTSLLAPNSATKVRLYDMSQIYNDIFTNPTKYGFKDSVTPWNGSASLSPNDLIWWDSLHGTAAVYRYVASRLIQLFSNWGFIL